jgi:hypothetical protein
LVQGIAKYTHNLRDFIQHLRIRDIW